MITCDECGRENDEEYKFCLGCGAALEQADEDEPEEEGKSDIINCPFCGAEQPLNFKFCGSCGEKIPDVAPADEGEQKQTTPGKPGGDQAEEEEDEEPVHVESKPEPKPGLHAKSEGEEEDQQPPPMPSNIPSAGGGAPSESTPGVAAKNDQKEAERAEKPAPKEEKPANAAPAQLVVIRPDGTEGASIDVPKDKLTIGRDSEIEALNSDPFLSPSHASVLYKDGEFLIRDESSLNGIFREVTDEVELQDGDLIRVGQELIRYNSLSENPNDDADGTLAAGSPEPGYWGRLGIIAGPDVETEAYALEEDEVTIGRESGDIVFRDDGFVSGTHAQVARDGDGAVLRDLNSSNGTFLRIRDDYRLEDRERVLMGQQLFRLEVK